MHKIAREKNVQKTSSLPCLFFFTHLTCSVVQLKRFYYHYHLHTIRDAKKDLFLTFSSYLVS